jgi:hypothetical protein
VVVAAFVGISGAVLVTQRSGRVTTGAATTTTTAPPTRPSTTAARSPKVSARGLEAALVQAGSASFVMKLNPDKPDPDVGTPRSFGDIDFVRDISTFTIVSHIGPTAYQREGRTIKTRMMGSKKLWDTEEQASANGGSEGSIGDPSEIVPLLALVSDDALPANGSEAAISVDRGNKPLPKRGNASDVILANVTFPIQLLVRVDDKGRVNHLEATLKRKRRDTEVLVVDFTDFGVPVELDRRDCDDEAHFFKDPPLQMAPASTAAPMTSPVERPLVEARTASFDMITCSDFATTKTKSSGVMDFVDDRSVTRRIVDGVPVESVRARATHVDRTSNTSPWLPVEAGGRADPSTALVGDPSDVLFLLAMVDEGDLPPAGTEKKYRFTIPQWADRSNRSDDLMSELIGTPVTMRLTVDDKRRPVKLSALFVGRRGNMLKVTVELHDFGAPLAPLPPELAAMQADDDVKHVLQTMGDYAMPLDLDRVFGDFSAYGETHPKVRLVNGDIASGSAFEVSVSATESTRILAARSASGTCFLAKPTVSTVRNGATYSITFASHDAAQPCIATTEAAWAEFW